jgi:hypothetical protein
MMSLYDDKMIFETYRSMYTEDLASTTPPAPVAGGTVPTSAVSPTAPTAPSSGGIPGPEGFRKGARFQASSNIQGSKTWTITRQYPEEQTRVWAQPIVSRTDPTPTKEAEDWVEISTIQDGTWMSPEEGKANAQASAIAARKQGDVEDETSLIGKPFVAAAGALSQGAQQYDDPIGQAVTGGIEKGVKSIFKKEPKRGKGVFQYR